MTFNIAERIKQVREIEARVEQEEQELAERLRKFKAFAVKARAEIMQYLNETGQKSASTVYGGANWRPKITYRVTDKDEFRRHVIGTEQWELLTWAAAPAQVEEWVQADNPVPPGLYRNAVNILYITPPPKPRKKIAGKEEESEGNTEEPQEAAE